VADQGEKQHLVTVQLGVELIPGYSDQQLIAAQYRIGERAIYHFL
jgi:hypothetical protein